MHLELLRKTSPQSEANRELINRKREHRFLITYFELLDVAVPESKAATWIFQLRELMKFLYYFD